MGTQSLGAQDLDPLRAEVIRRRAIDTSIYWMRWANLGPHRRLTARRVAARLMYQSVLEQAQAEGIEIS